MIFSVESEATHEHELALHIEVETDALLTEAEPDAERSLETYEGDARFAQDRVETADGKLQSRAEGFERTFGAGGVARTGLRGDAGGGGRIDCRGKIFASAQPLRERDDRIRILLAGVHPVHFHGSRQASGRLVCERERGMKEETNSLGISVDNREVVVGSGGRNAARIPDTPERRRLEGQRGIREIVFGAQDGILTTLGIVTGVGSAEHDRATILLTGGLSLLVGALSMGVGEYLGGKSEREVVQCSIDVEQREMLEMPEEEFAEQVAYYRLKGFTDDEAVMIVERLKKNPDIWLHEMVRDEFGIDLREGQGGGLRSSLAMACSFALGAAIPVLPYVFAIPLGVATWLALLLAVVALFSIGVFAASLSKRNPLQKGFEIVAFGALVFGVAWAAGHYIPALFGHGAINLGG